MGMLVYTYILMGVPPPNGGNCDASLASFGESRTVYVL